MYVLPSPTDPPYPRKPLTTQFYYVAVSTLFVITASTEQLNGTTLGVTFFVFLPLPVPEVTPKIVPFSKTTHYTMS